MFRIGCLLLLLPSGQTLSFLCSLLLQLEARLHETRSQIKPFQKLISVANITWFIFQFFGSVLHELRRREFDFGHFDRSKISNRSEFSM